MFTALSLTSAETPDAPAKSNFAGCGVGVGRKMKMAGNAMPRRIEPLNYVADGVLRDGSLIHVRAIRPDDKLRLLEHFAGLSAKTRYFRFFGYKRELTEEDLARFTELDFVRHVGLAATLWRNGRERFIGVGRYIRTDDPRRAEMALAVLDEYQGAGIGPFLVRHLARIANESGITRFEADVRGDNSRMLAVLRKSGCILSHSDDAGIVHFSLQCPELSVTEAAGGTLMHTANPTHDAAAERPWSSAIRPIGASDAQWLEELALLRWVDDGGRWGVENDSAHREVRI